MIKPGNAADPIGMPKSRKPEPMDACVRRALRRMLKASLLILLAVRLLVCAAQFFGVALP